MEESARSHCKGQGHIAKDREANCGECASGNGNAGEGGTIWG